MVDIGGYGVKKKDRKFIPTLPTTNSRKPTNDAGLSGVGMKKTIPTLSPPQ